eukprot:5733431-Prymnesium_polylepis.1
MLVVNMPRTLSITFGGIAYCLLLSALLYALRVDDGAGRLYGSGVEAFCFVLFAQALGYGSGFVMFDVYGATDVNAHISGAMLGGIVLVVPTLSRVVTGASNSGRNFRHGLVIAVVLELFWLVLLITLRVVLDLEQSATVQLAAGYGLSFVAILALAIWRFIVTVGLVYLLCVATAVVSIVLVNIVDVQMQVMALLSVLPPVGYVVILVLAYPLSRQRAILREQAMLDRQAAELRAIVP